jgi:hypothetical protein
MGTSDAHTSLTVVGNLAASLENRKKDVSALLYSDAGHGADQDAEDFIVWIAKTTGFTGRTTSSAPGGAWASWMM